MLYIVVLTFESADKILNCYHSNTFLLYCLLCCARWFWLLSLWLVNKILKCYNSNRFGESYWAVLSYVFWLLRCTKWFLLSSLWMTSRSATSKTKATDQHFQWKIVTCNYQLTVIELVKFIHHNIKESRIWRDKMYIELAGAHHMGHKHLKAHWAIHGWELCDERLFRTRCRQELWEHCDV